MFSWHFVIRIAPQSQLDVLSLFQFYSLFIEENGSFKIFTRKETMALSEIGECFILSRRDEWDVDIYHKRWGAVMVAMQLHQCQMLRCVSNPCNPADMQLCTRFSFTATFNFQGWRCGVCLITIYYATYIYLSKVHGRCHKNIYHLQYIGTR